MQNRAQGAIEYLLIIGAAILIVAVVMIGLGGLLNSGTASTNTDSDTYSGALTDMKY